MSITLLLVLIALGAIGYFLWQNPDIRAKLGAGARINADKAANSLATDLERETDAIKQLAAKLPEQQRLVAKIGATVDEFQHDYESAGTSRDAVKQKFDTMAGPKDPAVPLTSPLTGEALTKAFPKARVSPDALLKLATDYAESKKNVADLEKRLTEAHADLAEAEKELAKFEQQIESAKRDLKSDKGQAELATLLENTAKFRQDMNSLKDSFSTIGEARSNIKRKLDENRRLNDMTKGDKLSREIDDAADRLDAEAALRDLTGDLGK
jgi:chromosome segregation ATPase